MVSTFSQRKRLPISSTTAILLVLAGILSLAMAPAQISGSGPGDGVPDEIGGLGVLTTLEAADNPCFAKAGAKGRIFLRSNASGPDAAIEGISHEELRTWLSKGWLVSIVGPDISKADILRNAARSSEDVDELGCPRGGPSQVEGPPTASSSSPRSYAIDANWWDSSSKTLVSQSVDWNAPTVGNSQDQYSVFTTQVRTVVSPDFYMLQNGNYYQNGVGHVAWTSTYWDYYFWHYAMDYVAGHRYYHTNHYSGSPGTWYLCAQDTTVGPGTYECNSDPAPGTSIIPDLQHTSVWFENFNTVSNWYNGFTNPMSAFNALQRQAGSSQYEPWDDDVPSERDCSNNVIPNDAVTGGLAQSGTAYWALDKIAVC